MTTIGLRDRIRRRELYSDLKRRKRGLEPVKSSDTELSEQEEIEEEVEISPILPFQNEAFIRASKL